MKRKNRKKISRKKKTWGNNKNEGQTRSGESTKP